MLVRDGQDGIRRVARDACVVTIVAWGRAVLTAMSAAQTLLEEGVSAEVIDLRTLVPPDLDFVRESVQKTGRLIVAAEDRSFAGFVRSIQGAMVECFPSLPTRALGQKNIPGIAQSLILEQATILSEADITQAAHELCAQNIDRRGTGWSWIPPRYFIS